MSANPPLKEILRLIDDMYLFQVGPFGTIIAEECKEVWEKKYRRLTYAHIPAYIELLTKEIDSEDSVVNFFHDLDTIEEFEEISEIKNYLHSKI